jgi:hypothetical protein
MAFVDGESLRAKFDREKQLPVEPAGAPGIFANTEMETVTEGAVG